MECCILESILCSVYNWDFWQSFLGCIHSCNVISWVSLGPGTVEGFFNIIKGIRLYFTYVFGRRKLFWYEVLVVYSIALEGSSCEYLVVVFLKRNTNVSRTLVILIITLVLSLPESWSFKSFIWFERDLFASTYFMWNVSCLIL